MLSYRHSFHAGNFADVIKHVVLIEILEHLLKKEVPFEYIDTHAGAGLYDLKSTHATKLQEHFNGISKLSRKNFPELTRYFDVIKKYNDSSSLQFYPGSPLITQNLLRPQDRAWLFELHPQDYLLLKNNVGKHKKIRVSSENGFKGLLALLPPDSRRALILIDPSYEVKTDYDLVVTTLIKAHKKFATGIYAIWYPVVDRHKIETLEHKLILSGIKNIQRFELGLSADSKERGMTSAGMFVINPPWTLFEKMSDLLPKLARALCVNTDVELNTNNNLYFKCDVISSE